MYNSAEEGNRGANIIPSARRSIHEHRDRNYCPFMYNEVMGKKLSNRRNVPNNLHGEGVDVVDNVQSKMARPSSPVPVIRRKISIDVPINEYSDDEDDENFLSKSSPATFSSYYSNELYASALQNEQNRSNNTSNISTSQNRSRNNILETNSPTNGFRKIEPENNTSNYLLYFVIFAVIAVGLGIKSDYFNSVNIKEDVIYDEMNFYNDLKSLRTKYNVNGNSMLQIRIGISTIFKKEETGSFIFVYNSKSHNYNPMILDNFMEDIASKTARYLRNDSGKLQHVVVDTKNIRTDEELMSMYREDVDRTGVMLVKNVNNVPSQLAMAFHYYCDEYNPLVKRSAIFFTLDSATCNNNSDQKLTHMYVENCLSKQWNNIHEDKIGPLLTRVVNVIIDVTNIDIL